MNLRTSLIACLSHSWRAVVIGMLCVAGLAWADEYTEVQRLQGTGQSAEALARADKYIAANPRDPQMRFIKSQVLSQTGQGAAAETLLTELTRDYPELAEPWNNLAVLYAARGELDQAREALLTALRLKPDYATALENLGDVQARAASQSYERARKLDGANPRLGAKIDTLRSLHARQAPAGK